MCSPTSLVALQGVGVVSNTMSSVFQAKAQQSSLRYQADMAEIEARINEYSAQQETRRGNELEQNLRMDAAQLKSSQRVAFAANGLEMTEETPVNILKSTDYMTDRDARNIQVGAALNAFGHRSRAINNQLSAGANRAAAGAISPFMAGASSFLSGASSVATSWYTMNKYNDLLKSKESTQDSSPDPTPKRTFTRSGFGGRGGF